MDNTLIQTGMQIVQIIVVPATFVIGFFSFKKVMESHKISEELKKANDDTRNIFAK